MSFNEEIKLLRKKSLMTQDEFTQKIGGSIVIINRWETGKAHPNIATIKRVKIFAKIMNYHLIYWK